MSRDLNESAPALADDALLVPFRESADPVLTARQVADNVVLDRDVVEDALERLARDGVLEHKTAGDERVWWLPGHTATEASRGPKPGATRDEGGLPQPIENAISTLDSPDERERAAIYAVCYYLLERGATTPETIRRDVYPDHEAEYDDSADWWREAVRPALAALPVVSRTDGEWRLD